MCPHIHKSENEQSEEQKILLRLCEKSIGLSGRSLRKIPFIAHALFLSSSSVSLISFLEAMEKAVIKEKIERTQFEYFDKDSV